MFSKSSSLGDKITHLCPQALLPPGTLTVPGGSPSVPQPTKAAEAQRKKATKQLRCARNIPLPLIYDEQVTTTVPPFVELKQAGTPFLKPIRPC